MIIATDGDGDTIESDEYQLAILREIEPPSELGTGVEFSEANLETAA